MEGECRVKQVPDRLGPAGKASQDQIGHILRERMGLSGVAGGLERGILVGIFSGGWGTGPELALGCSGWSAGDGTSLPAVPRCQEVTQRIP